MENKNLETSPEGVNIEQENQQPVKKETMNGNGFQPPKKPFFKWTIIILAGIVIGLLIPISIFFIDFYISHQPWKSGTPATPPQQVIDDETSQQNRPQDFQNWQTYRNAEFGFEVKYPGDWNINVNKTGFISILPADFQKSTVDSSGTIGIMVQQTNSSVETDSDAVAAFNAFMDSCNTETPSSCDEKVSDVYRFKKQIAVGGKPAFQTEGGCCLDIGRHVFIFNGSYKYRITLYTDSLPKEHFINEDVFDQILSTFRFVESSAIQWNWDLLGCGGQTPCSYRVSASEWPDSYTCVGKYNSSSGQGEITPTSSTDPRTTTDFTCEKD